MSDSIMKKLISFPVAVLISIALFCIGMMIVGGSICLSEGCCYTTPQEIADREKTLINLSQVWVALAAVNTVLIVTLFVRWIKRRRVG